MGVDDVRDLLSLVFAGRLGICMSVDAVFIEGLRSITGFGWK
jgi:hypothetical protein